MFSPQTPRSKNLAIGSHFSILQSRLPEKDRQALGTYLTSPKERIYGAIVEIGAEFVTLSTTSPVQGYLLSVKRGLLKYEPTPVETPTNSFYASSPSSSFSSVASSQASQLESPARNLPAASL